MKNIRFHEFVASYFFCVSANLTDFKRYQRIFKNTFSIILNVKRNNFPIKCILKNNETLKIKTRYKINNFVLASSFGISYDLENDFFYNFPNSSLKLFSGEGNGDAAPILENHYKKVSVKNRVVVDIGANIGDTAISFILDGAKKIIGLEPFIENYEIAKKNIEYNNLSNKIEIIHAGCSSHSGHLTVKKSNHVGTRSGLIQSDSGDQIPLMSLTDLANKFHITNAILKLDCEGCEYDVINNSPSEILKQFSDIILEYHLGYLDIKKKLESCGFNVSYTSPIFTLDTHNFQGILYAKLLN